MAYTEINVTESILQRIEYDKSFTDARAGKDRDKIHHVNFEVQNEETIENIASRMGSVSVFMEHLAMKAHDLSLWKNVDEINMERLSHLLCTDGMLEEMLS